MRRLLIASAMLASACGLSHADTLTFRGTAAPTCALNTPVDGTIILGASLSSWSTATPASITAVNTAPATLTVTKPTAWASSPASTPSTTFTVSAATAGANVGALTGSGAATSGPLTALGTNTLTVSLGATASTPFHAGLHTAEVTVTCSVP